MKNGEVLKHRRNDRLLLVNEGGFIATVEGRCFMPSSQIDAGQLKIDHFCPLKVIATRIDKTRDNI